jgi:roadblock/LC7 domain-containing protein
MFKKFLSPCISVLLILISTGAFAQKTSPNKEIFERLIVQIDSSSWIQETFRVSPDSKRVAYMARLGNKIFVVVDGQEEKQYDGIGATGPIFSPDSKRVAYMARLGNKRFVVVDGKEEKQYDGLAGPLFSPDSKRVAYMARLGNKIFVVVDGKAIRWHWGR